MADLEVRVKSHNVEISFVEDVPSYVSLETVWVHVVGVPHSLRHFLGLWAVGSVIGATQDVDLYALHRHGIVRIQVAERSMDIFSSDDISGGESTLAEAFVKLDGYCFRYQVEKDDYIPDANFIPIVWKHHDDGPDRGHDHDTEEKC